MSTDAIASVSGNGLRRWSALVVLALGVLMIVFNATIMHVTLPSIRKDLVLTEHSLVWVVNAYTLAFGGSLLLGGRLGDHYGHRRLFLIGIILFTLGSLSCSVASTPALLIFGRMIQGSGGALVVAVALSLIMSIFTNEAERAKAIGIYGFICVGGGSVGLLLGGMLTSALNWHWVFVINLPIGVIVYALCLSWVPHSKLESIEGRLDVWGAITITASLVLATYVIVNANSAGWISSQTLVLLTSAVLIFIVFLIIEAHVQRPLVPLGILGLRDLLISNVVRILWVAGASASFFIAFYLQLVLGYEPIQVSFALLPGNVITASALGLSARMVTRFGVRKPIGIGLALGAVGLALFARAPADGEVWIDVLPGTVLIGLGVGIASIPLMFASMTGVAPRETGLVSGVINTVSTMGSAIGFAVLVAVSSSQTTRLLALGASIPVALTGGYHIAFLTGAACAGTAALIGAVFLPAKTGRAA